jgi:hypothetical protein
MAEPVKKQKLVWNSPVPVISPPMTRWIPHNNWDHEFGSHNHDANDARDQLALLDPECNTPEPIVSLLVQAVLSTAVIAQELKRVVDQHQLQRMQTQSEPILISDSETVQTAPARVPVVAPLSTIVTPIAPVHLPRIPPPPVAVTTPPGVAGQKRKRAAKPADKDFSYLLPQVDVKMGLTGKYDKLSDARERNIGIGMPSTLEKLMETKILGHVTPESSWATKKSAANTILNILLTVCETNGRMGRETRNGAYEMDAQLYRAVQMFTAEERSQLATEYEGLFVNELMNLITEAKSYCIMGRLTWVKNLLLGEPYEVVKINLMPSTFEKDHLVNPDKRPRKGIYAPRASNQNLHHGLDLV